MKRFACVAVVAMTAVYAAPPAVAQQDEAPEEGVTRTQFQDWTRICDANGQCAIEQVGKTADDQDALLFQLRKLPQPQEVDGVSITAVAVIRVPLSVVLTNQLRLQVDDGEVAASPFFACDPSGCLVRAPLRPEQLAAFRAGVTAKFEYTLLQNDQSGDIQSSVSLLGFTRAFDSL